MDVLKRLPLALLLLRVGVFIVMLMWTLDKFVNPEHAASVFKKFYFISGLNAEMFYVIGEPHSRRTALSRSMAIR